MSNQLVSDEMVHDALAVLQDTAIAYARASAKARVGERVAKAKRARIEAGSKLKTAAERSAFAESSEHYETALQEWEDAVHEATLLSAQRERAKYIIECWRSIQANARQGKL